VAAILLPGLVSRLGMGAGFRGLAAFCLLGALASFLWIREPPHRPAAVVSAVLPEGAEDTQPRLLYNRQLWKLVGASSSLVVCQFTFVAFLVEMLHGRRGISLALAGLVFASAQICGGAARIIVGAWSDRSVGRIRPLRSIAFGMAGGGLLLGAVTDGPLWLLVPVAVAVGTLFICWNGLAFTAAGEMADVSQVGAALGLQNTASFLSTSVTSVVAGLLISLVGFPAVYALTAVPALGAGLLLMRLANSRSVSLVTNRCEPCSTTAWRTLDT
jgi:predicted MFS family arabinose efflux permease